MAATMAAIMEITENIMRRMHEPSTKLHNALYFMSGMMVVILALVIVAGVKTKAENAGFHIADDTENSYEQQVAGQTDTTQDSGQEKWQEGVVAYQGKEYLYNTDIKTYLMMGVDIDGPVQQSSDYTQGGQSDALFLLVVNNKTEQLQVISINRNTMADIELCDEEGIDMGPLKTQICLQHAFGDGKRLSCSKTVDAVSGLFQNIPISGYLAMNMGGIPQMNDAVGGVEVTVQQDISFPKAGVNLKKGQKVTLNGTQAYYYLHGRDTEEYDSATKRLQREEQYIVAYMDKLKKVKEDLAQIEDIEITSSWFNNVEIMHKGVNKGEALKALINYLGIDKDDVIAFGDNYNDLPMLELAGIGVVMGNANDEVKEKGDYITAKNTEDGVAKAIYKFLKI